MRIAGLVLAWALCAPALTLGADADRGRALYETTCVRCHDRSVHVRQSRKARSIPSIRAQVERWSKELGTRWTREDIDDVTEYLNGRYYFFDCPRRVCRVGPTAQDIGPRSSE